MREKRPIFQHNQRRPNPFICIYCTESMSAGSTLSNAAESPPIIVFQSRALRMPSADDNDFGCIRDPQFSTPCKRSLATDSVRSPTHISKRSRLCVGGGGAPPPSFEFCVQPVNMSFVLSGSMPRISRISLTYFPAQLPTMQKIPPLAPHLPWRVPGPKMDWAVLAGLASCRYSPGLLLRLLRHM